MLELNSEEAEQLAQYLNTELAKPNCRTIKVPGILKQPGVSSKAGEVGKQMRFSSKAIVYAVAAVFLMALGFICKIITGQLDSVMIVGGMIMMFLHVGEIVSSDKFEIIGPENKNPE